MAPTPRCQTTDVLQGLAAAVLGMHSQRYNLTVSFILGGVCPGKEFYVGVKQKKPCGRHATVRIRTRR